MAEHPVTVALVGDTFCGKTNLLFSYARDEFLEAYLTTITDEYIVRDFSIETGKGPQWVKLSLWDLGG